MFAFSCRSVFSNIVCLLWVLPSLETLAMSARMPTLSSIARTDSAQEILSNDTINAVKFEASNRAHGSIRDAPFYTVSENTANAQPGTLLKIEKETNTTLYTMPPSLAMSRFIYQSKTSNGTIVPVSAYILWPYTAIPYDGGLPVVVWAHGTSGVSAQCAPSNIRNLWHHFQVPYQLALAGYVVVATDYAGLGVEKDAHGKFIVHEYLTSPAQANDIMYSIPAAREAFPELSKEFVIIGSSEGGGAVWGVAQKFASEPTAGFLGTVALSPVTRVLALPTDEAILGLLVVMMIPGIESNFPGFNRADILEQKGLQTLDTYLDLQGCNTVLFQLPAGLDILKPNWRDNPHVQQWQELAANGGKAIGGPMLVIQGGMDPIVHAQTTTDAVNETAKMFPMAHIEYNLLPEITHGPAMHAGQRLYMDWIAQRFAQKPTKPGLQSYVAVPVRPASALQPETNFFLALETEPWQAT